MTLSQCTLPQIRTMKVHLTAAAHILLLLGDYAALFPWQKPQSFANLYPYRSLYTLTLCSYRPSSTHYKTPAAYVVLFAALSYFPALILTLSVDNLLSETTLICYLTLLPNTARPLFRGQLRGRLAEPKEIQGAQKCKQSKGCFTWNPR